MLPFLINLKFTGLVYSAVFSIGVALFLAVKNRALPTKLIAASTMLFAASIGVIGYNPYIINLVDRGNPFFPAYQPETGITVVDNQADPSFLKRNRFEKFVNANLSVLQKRDESFSPRFAIPLIEWNTVPTVALRFSGFGPVFYVALIVAVLLLVAGSEVRLKYFGVLVLATAFSTDVGWWARLAPQTWLAFCLLVIAVAAWPTRGRGQQIAWAVVVLMLCNSAFVGARVAHRQVHRSMKFAAHVDIARSDARSVIVVDNDAGLYGFYNRRKVLDRLGGDVQIVEHCDPARRNQRFQVCERDHSPRNVLTEGYP